jgi:ribosomal protein L22
MAAGDKKAKNPTSGGADAKPESEAKRETTAKRAAEKKSGGKSAGGSKQAKKAEAKGASQAKKKASSSTKTESKAKPKATATKPGTKSAAKSTSKTADPKSGAKAASTARKAASTTAKANKEEPPVRPVVNASARFVRVAPRKARLIADQVRGLPLEDAQTLLRFSPRGAARDIAKVLASAAANAENNHDLVADELLVKSVTVDEGPTLRRYRPRALGRATKINKRTSHIAVALTPEEE